MMVTRSCPVTGDTITRDVPCTERQMTMWEAGQLIQLAMPNVSREDREFVMSGMTPEVWAQTMGVEEDEPEVDGQDEVDAAFGAWDRTMRRAH